MFTQNRFCAAPVIVAREHLASSAGDVRALVVNTGNANAGTGERGLAAARATCEAAAKLLGCTPSQVLPFSTGVIMEPLPVERIVAGLPHCIRDSERRQLGARRRGDHDDRHAAQSGVAAAQRIGTRDDHGHRHRQRRRA